MRVILFSRMFLGVDKERGDDEDRYLFVVEPFEDGDEASFECDRD